VLKANTMKIIGQVLNKYFAMGILSFSSERKTESPDNNESSVMTTVDMCSP